MRSFQVGFGNASGSLVTLTSFLCAMVMSRWVSDFTLITIGMLSYVTGMFLMAFVTTTYVFYMGKFQWQMSKLGTIKVFTIKQHMCLEMLCCF